MTDGMDKQYPVAPIAPGPGVGRELAPAGVELQGYRVVRNDADAVSDGEPRTEFTLRDILYGLFRHKWKIATVFFLGCAATFVYVASIPKIYESRATLLIKKDRKGLEVNPSASGGSMLRAGKGAGVEVRAEIEILLSDTIAKRVVERLGVNTVLGRVVARAAEPVADDTGTEPPPVPPAQPGDGEEAVEIADASAPSPLSEWQGKANLLAASIKEKLQLVPPTLDDEQRAVARVKSGLFVKPTSSRASTLSVTFTSRSAELAQTILNTVLSVYKEQHLEIHKSPLSEDFFISQSEQVEERLKSKEEELDRKYQELDIISRVSQEQLLLNRRASLESESQKALTQISSLNARLTAYSDQIELRSTDPDLVAERRMGDGVYDQMRQAMVQLKLQEISMMQRYQENSQPVQKLRRQIEQIEDVLEGKSEDPGEFDFAIDDISRDLMSRLENTKVELQAELARSETIEEKAVEVRAELGELMRQKKVLESLEREVDILDAQYRQYQASLQSVSISRALDRDMVSNIGVIQWASLPLMTQTSQKKILALLAFGICASLGGGVGLALTLEFTDSSIKTVEDAERRLGLPVLTVLPAARDHKPEIGRKVA